jgi:hypothetical protein
VPRFSEAKSALERQTYSYPELKAGSPSKGEVQRVIKVPFKKVEELPRGPNSIFSFGFKVVKEVGDDSGSIGDRLLWGATGTLMKLDLSDFFAEWNPKFIGLLSEKQKEVEEEKEFGEYTEFFQNLKPDVQEKIRKYPKEKQYEILRKLQKPNKKVVTIGNTK